MTISMDRLRPMIHLRAISTPRRLPVALVLAAATAGVLSACGGDDGSADEAPATVAGAGEDGTSAGTGAGDAVATGGDASEGAQLAQDYGCRSCHREGGGGIGPDWEGLYGSTVTLDDGSTLVADEAYLLESIVDPDAKKVDGYSIGMPVNDALSDEDIASIIAYIQSLGGDEGGSSSS